MHKYHLPNLLTLYLGLGPTGTYSITPDLCAYCSCGYKIVLRSRFLGPTFYMLGRSLYVSMYDVISFLRFELSECLPGFPIGLCYVYRLRAYLYVYVLSSPVKLGSVHWHIPGNLPLQVKKEFLYIYIM